MGTVETGLIPAPAMYKSPLVGDNLVFTVHSILSESSTLAVVTSDNNARFNLKFGTAPR